MSEPTVCAIMLTRDRPELAKRAVDCWKSQTYKSRLLIWDSGNVPLRLDIMGLDAKYSDGFAGVFHQRGETGLTIGRIRNDANAYPSQPHIGFHPHDIIIHWDDDDWSHPNRITEQVALLQASGADCVGYNEMLFWRGPGVVIDDGSGSPRLTLPPAEAWLYSCKAPSAILGTSLCYWRRTWEAKPFENTSRGEDAKFVMGLKLGYCGARGEPLWNLAHPNPYKNFPGFDRPPDYLRQHGLGEPRMIARIHGGNTCSQIIEGKPEWKRVPEWDEEVRKILT